jgi:hypothetical protein
MRIATYMAGVELEFLWQPRTLEFMQQADALSKVVDLRFDLVQDANQQIYAYAARRYLQR